MSSRRDFITLLGGAVAAWPLAARAQQAPMSVVGYLSGNLAESDPAKRGFIRGLSETGFFEGRNVAIEYRYAGNAFSRLPELASDLARRRVDVIVASASNAATLAAKAATTTIPIVFSIGGDPVTLGLVPSLSRPDRNLTGASFLGADTTKKMLEVLHELVPNARMAALINPANPNAETDTRELREAAGFLGVELEVFTAGNEQAIDAAFASIVAHHLGALVVAGDALFNDRSRQLAALTLRHGIPAIFQTRPNVEAGGLMSYGGSLEEASRVTGLYAGRILKGEKLFNLPVQQVTKVELVINLTTAKALGITVPITLLGRADDVIE
jgi:putative ABC transport system substrate-binding protein